MTIRKSFWIICLWHFLEFRLLQHISTNQNASNKCYLHSKILEWAKEGLHHFELDMKLLRWRKTEALTQTPLRFKHVMFLHVLWLRVLFLFRQISVACICIGLCLFYDRLKFSFVSIFTLHVDLCLVRLVSFMILKFEQL